MPPAVRDLLELLASDRRALLFLTNALDSVAERLVDRSLVKDLLADFADEMEQFPRSRWADALWRVCNGTAQRRRLGGYMRQSNAASVEGPAVTAWTTVVSEVVWHDCHYAGPRAGFPTPPFPADRGEAFRREFNALVSQPDWFRPPTESDGAWLGRPASDAANCWISCTELDDSATDRPKDLNGPARRVVEALGMLPLPLKSYVRYTVDAVTVRAQAGDRSRRPWCGDLGNEWFRGVGRGRRATRYAECGWGSTVHLSVVRVASPEDAGRPERVAPSMRLDAVPILNIEWIFPNVSRATFEKAPYAEFMRRLFAGRTIGDLRTEIGALYD